MLRLLAEGLNSGYLALLGYSLGRSTMRLSFRPLDSGNAGGIKVGGSTFPDADRLYLEAPDERGPVEGLTPNDAAIFDGGRKRETTRLVPQTIPCASSLLVDNARSTQRFSQEIRSGIVAFADAIPPERELGLVTIGKTPVVRQEPAEDRTRLNQIAKTLTTGGTTVLVNAVYEMYDRFLRNTDDRWPVLVIVTSDGTEGSGQFYPENFAAFGRACRPRMSSRTGLR